MARQTYVSSCIYVHNTSAEAFPDPFTFDPERWLCDPETYKEREKRMLSFSRGSRACIGIKYVKHRAMPIPNSCDVDRNRSSVANYFGLCLVWRTRVCISRWLIFSVGLRSMYTAGLRRRIWNGMTGSFQFRKENSEEWFGNAQVRLRIGGEAVLLVRCRISIYLFNMLLDMRKDLCPREINV